MFKFDVSNDSILQSEPLEFRVMDHDVYSSDDPVGVVHVDLSPLLMRSDETDGGDRMLKGWFPIYDTLRGVRGELHLEIKVDFISDENKYRDSAAGVSFFAMSNLEPKIFTTLQVIGFVEVRPLGAATLSVSCR